MTREPVSEKNPALSLYAGKVMHARLKPVGHRFSYSVASILIDLDRLDEAGKSCAIFSVNRWNLAAFHEKDHGPRDGTSLRGHVDRLMRNAGLPRPARVELLCYPSILGYTFNPLAVYFCRDEAGEATALIYQVHNTFGESHTYVEPVLSGQASPAGIRQTRSKGFYVSPFLDMDLTYLFRIKPPADEVALRILETDREGPVLAATFHGVRKPADLSGFATSILKTLGIPWKVMVGIHLEALRLWLKGVKLHVRPAPPAPESYSGNPGKRPGLAPGE